VDWGGHCVAPVCVKVDPQRRRFGRREADFALQRLEECRALEPCCCLLLQYRIQSCARGGRRIVVDMCYEIRRAEASVDYSDHHTLANAGERDSV
jgi:hypothetical protein